MTLSVDFRTAGITGASVSANAQLNKPNEHVRPGRIFR
jgi:hypothetical protein